jgi:hypothetical protein
MPHLETIIRVTRQRVTQYTHEAAEKRLQARVCAEEVPPNEINGQLFITRARECVELAKKEANQYKTLSTLRETILQARRNAETAQLLGDSRNEIQHLLQQLNTAVGSSTDLESLIEEVREQYGEVQQHTNILNEPLLPNSNAVEEEKEQQPKTTVATATAAAVKSTRTRTKQGAFG